MSIILTPMEFSGTVQLERRLFRKRVLPVDTIQYEGREIEFTPDYLQKMVQSFNDGAFDNVPLQFAADDNKHTNKIEQYRGDVVAMALEDDGLYVTVAATPNGAQWLKENPKVGISARIVNDYDRADGKHFDAAMQHALVTHDPRIPGLGPWSEVNSFSNSNDSDIIDLTGSEFGKPDQEKTKEKSVPKKDNSLSEAELERLRSFLAELDEDVEDDSSADVDDSKDDELTDEELAGLLEALDGESTAETDAKTEPELADASLSNADNTALELANQHATELSRIRAELDDERWAVDRTRLMKDLGLPPAVLDMAKPLLKGSGHTIDLANNESVDAGKIMRDVLTEVGKQIKLLDLGNELGSEFEREPDVSEEAANRRDETTKAVRAMMGN